MHLAILMTNTDETPFADRHPRDGEKFQVLLQEARSDWSFEVFSVKDGIFPNDINLFDGVIVTGSPASVRDAEDWVSDLLHLLRDIIAMKKPMFGACFGHQAIATALGGTVVASTDGCKIAGFAIGDHVLTTQYHPEMTDEFIAALLEEMSSDLPSDMIAPAIDSLERPAQRKEVASLIATFFEAGKRS